VSALASYYALVSRKTLSGSPEGGFEPEQKLTRFEALRSYTLDAAYAAFEEKVKGSLAVGKWADMAILDRDILTCAEAEILTTRVLRTIKGGKTVYEQAP
jgi:predicted amidohydrolase YtcJ